MNLDRCGFDPQHGPEDCYIDFVSHPRKPLVSEPRHVAERTAELVDAGRRKDEFLAMLAHELRNPLAAIRLAAQLVVLPELPQAQLAKSAAVIHRQVEHLVRLIDDLVDVSRITRGLISLRREPTEISAVAAQAIESSRPVIDAKHHILTVSVPDESLRVNGDAARLSQIVGNILNNAAKFTDAGGLFGAGLPMLDESGAPMWSTVAKSLAAGTF